MNQMLEFSLEEAVGTLGPARIGFCTWAARNQLHFALTLSGSVAYIIDDSLKTLIAVSNQHGALRILMHPYALYLFRLEPECFYFLIMHELRHLLQIRDFAEAQQLINIEAIERVFLAKVDLILLHGLHPPSREQLDRLRHNIFNIAADAALHVDLRDLFGDGIMASIDKFLKIVVPMMDPDNKSDLDDIGMITVAGLRTITNNQELSSNRDWLYYAKAYVAYLADKFGKAEDGEFLSWIQTGASIGQLYAVDKHDFTFDEVDTVRRAVTRATTGAKRLREACHSERSARRSRLKYGRDEGDDVAEINGRVALNQRIKAAVERVHVTVRSKRLALGRGRYSYGVANCVLPGLPGRRSEIRPQRGRFVVLVLDTSRSMWIPGFFQQMVALARYLKERRLLSHVYTCDTQITRVNLEASGAVYLAGGGGTSWTVGHNTQLLCDLGIKSGVDIYYATDGDVHGLDDAVRDNRVSIQIINIPNLLETP